MDEIIARITSEDPNRSLPQLLSMPLGLDVWESKPERLVLRATEAVLDRIGKMGYRVEPVVPVSEHLTAFATSAAAEGFHSGESLEQDMRELAAKRPELVEIKEIGRSLENRPILALRIGERKSGVRKLLFMGCHHAREWFAVKVPFLLARELIERADEAPIAGWLGKGESWIAPMVNPDGHAFCRGHNRLWRKNRRPNPDGSFGVDPNRNYGYMWGVLNTSSHVPSDDTYIGPRAFSEPETRAIRDLVAAEKFAGLITYHSYSQLILYPWGYTVDEIVDPVDRAALSGLAKDMAGAIKAVHGVAYVPEQSSQLYRTAGDTTDWTYGTYAIPSFTIELRPSSAEEGGFVVPASQIEPTYQENRAAAFLLIDRLLSSGAARPAGLTRSASKRPRRAVKEGG